MGQSERLSPGFPGQGTVVRIALGVGAGEGANPLPPQAIPKCCLSG